MNSSIEDIAFLARSNHRVEVLNALVKRPRIRNDLRATMEASSPTMGCVLDDLEERRWIAKKGRTYELTLLGEFVAERFMDLLEAMETEWTLRDIWQWLPHEMDGFRVELFSDAIVSYPGPGYPYQPIKRVTQLIEETETMRDTLTRLRLFRDVCAHRCYLGLERYPVDLRDELCSHRGADDPTAGLEPVPSGLRD